MRRVVPEYRTSPTLDALQELTDVAALLPAAVARRAALSTSELHALRYLMDEPLGPVELARRLGVTSAASSGVVDRLVSHGHVVRQAHPADGRRTVVSVTDSGRLEVARLMAPMFAALAQLDGELSDADREVVQRYLSGATAAMRALL